MKSRIITLLVALLCLPLVGRGQSVWNGTADVSWYNESQTEFTISTAEELAGLAKLVNEGKNFDEKTVKLGADIILNENSENYRDWENQAPQNVWVPIGKDSDDQSFCGTFDGNGYTIKGLYCKGEKGENNYGLFGMISTINSKNDPDGTKIENVKVVDSYIESFGGNVGGITGQIGTNAIISNCYFDGLIKGHDNVRIGGICGGDGQMGIPKNEIEECHNAGDIIVNMTEEFSAAGVYYYIGGIGGNANIIRECYNTGNITVSINGLSFTDSNYAYILISGVGFAATMESCYNTGKIQLSGAGNSHCLIGVGGLSGGDTPDIKNSYNYGVITSNIEPIESFMEAEETCGIGSILGLDYETFGSYSFENNYYLELTTENINPIGGSVTGCIIDASNIHSATDDEFKSGKIAHALRENGYGQNLDEYGNAIDQTPVLLCFAGDEQKVYKLTLESDAITEISGDIYRNAEPAKLLQQEVYDELMADAEEGKDLIWKNTEGEVVAIGNDYTPSTDETLTAEWGDVYTINTVVEPAGAGTILVQAKAQEGDEILFTVTANEGYELTSVSAGEIALTEANGSYSFTMPAENVTITATFNKVETEQPGDDDDEDQGNTGIHKPQRPIKYYNIYIDTVCPGLNVEVNKDVVQEGHQVSAYLTIQAECDTTGMRFEYKRGLFGYWQDLKALEGVQPGEYIIKNIYTDIYIRALDATLPEEEPTGIDDLEGVKAYAKEGSIYVYTPNREEVTIISMSGAIIKHAEQVGMQSYSVNRGIYIVRIGEKVFKLKN